MEGHAFHLANMTLYRVIQSSRRVLKGVVGDIIWNNNVNIYFFILEPVFDLQRVYTDVAFLITIIDFYKFESFHFNFTCQFISLFTMKEESTFFPS
jgi:hypothetical protein